MQFCDVYDFSPNWNYFFFWQGSLQLFLSSDNVNNFHEYLFVDPII